MSRTVEISEATAEKIVIDHLKESFRLTQEVNPHDVEALLALCAVIRYYMTPNEYDKWMLEV